MGEVDDTVVYNMFKHVSTPGYQIDVENMRTPQLIITYPNGGNIFNVGENITQNSLFKKSAENEKSNSYYRSHIIGLQFVGVRPGILPTTRLEGWLENIGRFG